MGPNLIVASEPGETTDSLTNCLHLLSCSQAYPTHPDGTVGKPWNTMKTRHWEMVRNEPNHSTQ